MGPGSQTGRKASGIIITSDMEDWVPPEVAEAPPRRHDAAAVTASDWLPPGLPEPTSQPAGPERRRSTVNQVPPEVRAPVGPDPETAIQTPSAERDLKKRLTEVRQELEATREEAVRLRARLGKLELPAPVERQSDVSAGEERATAAGLLNVNTATVDELYALPGVGRRAAERIVAHREARGPFASVAGLLAVEGFPPDRVNRFSHLVTV